MHIGTAFTFLFFGLQIGLPPAFAQKQQVASVDFETELVYYRPRVAIAPDGAYAVAWETLRKLEVGEAWQIGLQRYTANSVAVDDRQYLLPSAFCNQHDSVVAAGLRNADMDFSPDGSLLMSMERFVNERKAGALAPRQRTSVVHRAMDRQSRPLHLNSDVSCEMTEVDPFDAGISGPSHLDGYPEANLILTAGKAVLDVSNSRDTPTLNPIGPFNPSIAVNAAGQRVVVWVDYSRSEWGNVYGRRFDGMGRQVGANFLVSDGRGAIDDQEGSRPEVAILEDGQFLVVWTDHREGKMRAWGRYFDENAFPRGAAFTLEPDDALTSGFPHVASNGHTFAYTWLVEHEGIGMVFVNIPGVTEAHEVPEDALISSLSLKGYPNPFSQATTLEYSLKDTGHVTLSIYDLLGREVKKLIDQPQGPGSYRVTLQAEELAMGFYVTRLQQGNRHQSQLLVRTD